METSQYNKFLQMLIKPIFFATPSMLWIYCEFARFFLLILNYEKKHQGDSF